MDMGLLRNGNKGENVRNLQAMLNSIGAKLVEDGVFGSETEKAVRAYQTIR